MADLLAAGIGLLAIAGMAWWARRSLRQQERTRLDYEGDRP